MPNRAGPVVGCDSDGAPRGRNLVHRSGVGWVDASSVGIAGDWCIRATIGYAGSETDAPKILSVSDVPEDQGHEAELRFARSRQDAPGAQVPISAYEIFRSDQSVRAIGDYSRTTGEEAAVAWKFVGRLPANRNLVYRATVPTLGDSTSAGGVKWSTFCVRAVSATIGLFFESAPDSGWTIDNLKPGMPTELTLTGSMLTWAPPVDSDVAHYSVYGQDLVAYDGDRHFVARSELPSIDIGLVAYPRYCVTATDSAGNEGPATHLQVESVAPVWGQPDLMNLSVAPNPFNPCTSIDFDLPDAGPVQLSVFDLSGRLVRAIVVQTETKGRHRTSWDGRDAQGGNVSSGTYVARLKFGGKVVSVRMSLIR